LFLKKTPWIASLSLAAIAAAMWFAWLPADTSVSDPSTEPTDAVTHAAGKTWNPPAPLQSARAMRYLEQLCAIGSRTTGTPGMIAQQQLLQAHFEKLGGNVVWQTFQHRHPETGQPVDVKNLIVQWHPDRMERVVLCSHYDTRPYPDRDPKNRFGLFVGANDGASSTAGLMELGHAMKDKSITIGVDFVLFDAEELVYGDQNGEYFVGSTYFAQQYAAEPPPYRYRAGILLDMIGDKNLQIYYDEVGFRYAPQIAREVWEIAKGLGIKEFTPRVVHAVRDDHLPMNEIAKIPTIDIIDFDYPTSSTRVRGYWHTMADTPDKCSGDSITKVLAAVLEWLKRQKS
jgi:glutaminyl-peptide cyclotransferase